MRQPKAATTPHPLQMISIFTTDPQERRDDRDARPRIGSRHAEFGAQVRVADTTCGFTSVGAEHGVRDTEAKLHAVRIPDLNKKSCAAPQWPVRRPGHRISRHPVGKASAMIRSDPHWPDWRMEDVEA